MRRILIASLLALIAVTPRVGAEKEASATPIGKKVANLTFQDAEGKKFSLHDVKDAKAVVIVFLSFECPVSNSYCEHLATLHMQYGKEGVRFVALTVNDDDTRAQVAKSARDYKIPFPVFKDDKLAAADALKADFTPECFVLDRDLVLRYRGRIDNSYSERLKKQPQITEHNLEDALKAVLAGKAVAKPATVAVGCMIAREARPLAKEGSVTYHRDVAPIVQNHCQSCHRPGEVGPFALMNYRQAVNWSQDIKEYTRKRIMPPWKVTEGVAFHNDRRMPQKDIDTLARWVDDGCPEGSAKDAPASRKFPEGWQLGTPDLVLTLSDEFQLGPSGRDLFRCFVLPTNLPQDTYVSAVEIRPGNPRIVHHVLLFIDGQGKGRQLEVAQQSKKPGEDPHSASVLDVGPGYSVSMGVGFAPQGGMGGWAPGQLPRYLPQGSGYFLPKNADVIAQVHFHRNGRLEKGKIQLGLYFAKGKVERPFQNVALAGSSGGTGPFRLFFSIPAGDERFPLKGDMWATNDFTLHTISPHMHMLGKEIKLTMTPPGGSPQTLLGIKEWDYNWQETFILKEPIAVKAGTKFHVEALYDNSAKNPNNPFTPPRRVTFGEQTFNEMCFMFMGGLSDSRGRRLPLGLNEPSKK